MKNKDVLDNIPRKVYKLYSLIGEVVYVGQTTDLIRRIGEHAFNYIFDTVTYRNVECKEDALNLESYLISKFNPKGNKQLTKRRVGLGSKLANIEEIVFIDSYEKPCNILYDILRNTTNLANYSFIGKYFKGSPYYDGDLFYQGMFITELDLYIGCYTLGDFTKVGISCDNVELILSIKDYLSSVKVFHFDHTLKKKGKIPTKKLLKLVDSDWLYRNGL